jgi:hypothetical protein
MSYVCGMLRDWFSVLPPSKLYNIIIDKGLMDASSVVKVEWSH